MSGEAEPAANNGDIFARASTKHDANLAAKTVLFLLGISISFAVYRRAEDQHGAETGGQAHRLVQQQRREQHGGHGVHIAQQRAGPGRQGLDRAEIQGVGDPGVDDAHHEE